MNFTKSRLVLINALRNLLSISKISSIEVKKESVTGIPYTKVEASEIDTVKKILNKLGFTLYNQEGSYYFFNKKNFVTSV